MKHLAAAAAVCAGCAQSARVPEYFQLTEAQQCEAESRQLAHPKPPWLLILDRGNSQWSVAFEPPLPCNEGVTREDGYRVICAGFLANVSVDADGQVARVGLAGEGCFTESLYSTCIFTAETIESTVDPVLASSNERGGTNGTRGTSEGATERKVCGTR